MKDEIKEILDKLDKIKTFGYNPDIINSFCYRDLITLLDYITNLKEENEKFKEYARSYLISKIERKNKELELVKTKLIEEHNKCYDYKSRCEKAIEYINKYPCETWYYAKDRQLILRQDELLNILQGVDK